MPDSTESAVEMYIRAICDSDRETRNALLKECLADDVRMVTQSREIRGRAQFTADLNRFLTFAGPLGDALDA